MPFSKLVREVFFSVFFLWVGVLLGKEMGSFLGGGGSFDNSIVGNGILNREVSKIEKSIKKWKNK